MQVHKRSLSVHRLDCPDPLKHRRRPVKKPLVTFGISAGTLFGTAFGSVQLYNVGHVESKLFGDPTPCLQASWSITAVMVTLCQCLGLL
jgi:hypothetical protein